MWTCRKCSAEVEDHFEICWSCGTGSDGSQDPNFRRFQSDDEVPGTEAPQDEAEPKRMTVATYWVADQAHRVQTLLENGGVPVCIAYEFAVVNATGSIQLQVTEEQVEKARQVLAGHPKETAPLPPLPPKPPEPDEEEKYKEQPWTAPIPKDLSREEVLRLLEAQVSALIDSKDTPDWKVNPAFHPDVIAFIQKHANNMGFVQKAQALQRNRAKYFATIRHQLLNPKPKEEEEAKAEQAAGPSALGEFGRKLKLWLIVRPLRWGLRLLKWAVVLGCVVLFLGFCASLIYGGYGSKQLEEAINETDEKDPGWTWNSLQVNRKAVPEKDNAALVVLGIANSLPKDWPEPRSPLREIGRLPANEPLSNDQLQTLRAELGRFGAAVKELDRLAALSTGRYPGSAEADSPAKFEFPVAAATTVADLAWLQAVLLAQEQQTDGAITSFRAILAVGRSGGDDPDSFAQTIRLACRKKACTSLERILAQTQTPSAMSLAGIQQSLTEEAKDNPLLPALRGFRVWADEILKQVENGDMELGGPLEVSPTDNPMPLVGSAPGGIKRWLQLGWIRENRAQTLRRMTEAVELAKRPVTEQVPAFEAFKNAVEQERATRLRLAATTVRLTFRVQVDYSFQQAARLQCTIAAVAAERYRLANERWPNGWEQLVPQFLPAVPLDLYTGQPLQLTKTPDGFTISSVGPPKDKPSDQGAIPGLPQLGPEVIAFRLWNPERRGQSTK